MVVVYTDPKLEINWIKKKNSNMLNLQFIEYIGIIASSKQATWTEHEGLNSPGEVEH